MDEELKKKVAVFRYTVIADFVGAVKLSRGERRRRLMEKCAQRWADTGKYKKQNRHVHYQGMDHPVNPIGALALAETSPDLDDDERAELREEAAKQMVAAASRERTRVGRVHLLARTAELFLQTEAAAGAREAVRREVQRATPQRIRVSREYLVENPEVAGPSGFALQAALLDENASNGELHDDGITLIGGRWLELAYVGAEGKDRAAETRQIEVSDEHLARITAALEESALLRTRIDRDATLPADAGRETFFERARLGLAEMRCARAATPSSHSAGCGRRTGSCAGGSRSCRWSWSSRAGSRTSGLGRLRGFGCRRRRRPRSCIANRLEEAAGDRHAASPIGPSQALPASGQRDRSKTHAGSTSSALDDLHMKIGNLAGLPRRLARAAWRRARTFAAVVNARRSSQHRLRGAPPQRILVVCYGNIYRSAFVAAYLRDCVAPDVEVRSAGFHPVPGRPSPARHIELCRRYGVSLEQHRSTVITPADVRWADLIVLMDRHNWAALSALDTDAQKLVWLGSLASGPVEIPDPYTLDDAVGKPAKILAVLIS